MHFCRLRVHDRRGFGSFYVFGADMKYKIIFDGGDNVYYQIVEADNIKQARGRFASAAARNDDFTFMEAINLIVGVEKCENQQ